MDKSNLKNEDNQLKEELARIDERIDELNKNISLGQDLEDLHNNEQFKRVFLEGYFEKEAERIFGVLTEPSHLKRDVMENLMDKLTSIRNVKQFFGTMLTNAHMAPEQIEEEKRYRSELTAEHSLDAGSEE